MGHPAFLYSEKKENPRLRFVRSHISKSRCGAPFDLLLRKSFNLPSFVTPREVSILSVLLRPREIPPVEIWLSHSSQERLEWGTQQFSMPKKVLALALLVL
jgi:hypothetical protein